MAPWVALTCKLGHPLVYPAEQGSALVFVPFPVWFHNGINTRPIRQDGTSPMARRQRLDLELVARGLAVSRQQAQQLIRSGRVRSGDRVLDKPGVDVAPELALEVEHPPRFVSRGGEKLVAALEQLPIAVSGRVCLDGGISTGGFTDCLLQHGASRVYGIDVGYGQTAWSLRTDPRVVLRERTNLRHLTPAELYGPEDPWPDLAVADVSFISLTRVIPALGALLRPAPVAAGAGGDPAGPSVEALLLVKPQFEVGRGRVGKGGVVRDPAAHVDAIETVLAAAVDQGWQAAGLVASPITGPAGNHEYLLWLRRQESPADSGGESSVGRHAAEGRRAAAPANGGSRDSGAQNTLVDPATEGWERDTSDADRALKPAEAGRAREPIGSEGAGDLFAAGRDGDAAGAGAGFEPQGTGEVMATADSGSAALANSNMSTGSTSPLVQATQPQGSGAEPRSSAAPASVDRAYIRVLVQRTLSRL